jgi:hypothetical protein
MTSNIYLLTDNTPIIETTQKAEQLEVLLQNLLAEYPSLWQAGESRDIGCEKTWLLVSENQTITNAKESSGDWALDHLFLDQEGIPTLVKVKRDHGIPIKREIVSQMLDYPTNVVNYWSIEKIRFQFELKPNAQQLLIELLGKENANADQFWQQVKTNLLAMKIRLVFVATQIPHELKRVVEFLNLQMKPAQFFAVEINQYISQPVWEI